MSGSGERAGRSKKQSLKITCYYGITLPLFEITSHPGGFWAWSFITNLNVFSLLTHLIPVRLDARVELNCCTSFVKISFHAFSVSLPFTTLMTSGFLKGSTLGHAECPWVAVGAGCAPSAHCNRSAVAELHNLEKQILLREHLQANTPRQTKGQP